MNHPGETLMPTDAWSGLVFSGKANQKFGAEERRGRMDRKLGHGFPEGNGEVGLLNG